MGAQFHFLISLKNNSVGHSMGAGTAALLTTMIRESVPGCADARCYALACPACMTMELAESCKEYVTSVINGTDIVPTFSGGIMLSSHNMHATLYMYMFSSSRKFKVYKSCPSMRNFGALSMLSSPDSPLPPSQPLWTVFGRMCGAAHGLLSFRGT